MSWKEIDRFSSHHLVTHAWVVDEIQWLPVEKFFFLSLTAYFHKSSVGCLHLEQLVWLEIQTFFTLVFGFPGGVLYGSGLSCGFCLPPLQDPQGWVSGSTGALSRSPVCSKVGTTGVRFMVYDYFITVMQLFSPLSLFNRASFFDSQNILNML